MISKSNDFHRKIYRLLMKAKHYSKLIEIMNLK